MVDYIAEAQGISMGSVSFKALFGKGSFFILSSNFLNFRLDIIF